MKGITINANIRNKTHEVIFVVSDSPELLLFLMNDELNQKVFDYCKKCGLTSATFFFAHTMTDNKIWKILGLDDMRRECILIVGPQNKTKAALDLVADKFNLDNQKTGIGLRVSLDHVLGVRKETEIKFNPQDFANEKGNTSMYDAIITIVDRGKADLVIDSANKHGAKGGTIIHGRGSASKSKKVFNMEIEPEKEIVAVIVKEDMANGVINAIADDLNIDKENAGILFTIPLKDVRGIF